MLGLSRSRCLFTFALVTSVSGSLGIPAEAAAKFTAVNIDQ